jgi:hypothetical protein
MLFVVVGAGLLHWLAVSVGLLGFGGASGRGENQEGVLQGGLSFRPFLFQRRCGKHFGGCGLMMVETPAHRELGDHRRNGCKPSAAIAAFAS